MKLLDIFEQVGLFELKIDNANGWGAVPDNLNVAYKGLKVTLRPSMFLKLASKLHTPTSSNDIAAHIQQNGAIGAPFLIIDLPEVWLDGDLTTPARIRGHEGRNRMIAVHQVEGDDPVETHIFFSKGYRRRHLSDDMIARLNENIISEDGQMVAGPWFIMPGNHITETKSISSKYKKLANSLEDYANKNIPKSQPGFGDFMYHAELIRKGHQDVHKQDLSTVQQRYRKTMSDMIKTHLNESDDTDTITISRVSITDHYKGESFGYKELKLNGKPSAAADINIVDDEVCIMNIVTRPDAVRNGLAKKLVDDLFKEFPDKHIMVSNMTDDGSKFFRSQYNVDDETGEIKLKTHSEQLAEAFDKVYPWKWAEKKDWYWAAEFKDVTVTIATGQTKSQWEVKFSRNYSMSITGGGDQFGIFATVIDIAKDFVRNMNPKVITFSAEKEDFSTKSISRPKLYSRMVRTFANKLGYDFKEQSPYSDYVDYILIRKNTDLEESTAQLSYIGNCTDDDVIEHIFGDATGFAQAVDEYGDEFTINDLVVKYDPETDIHSFYYKNNAVSENFAESNGMSFTFKIKRRKLNVPALIKAGAIFVTYPHGEQGWETDDKEVWSYSLISLYNVQQGGWTKDAIKYRKPESYTRAEQDINSSSPNLGTDKLVYDGKYKQILWSIKKLGIADNVAFLDDTKDIKETIAPHGSSSNEFAMMKAGTKPAALVGPDEYKNLYKPLMTKYNWVLAKLEVPGLKFIRYVVGQTGEQSRVDRIADLVKNMNIGMQSSKRADDAYHRELGTLLGYKESDIEHFLRNINNQRRKEAGNGSSTDSI